MSKQRELLGPEAALQAQRFEKLSSSSTNSRSGLIECKLELLEW
jgi:hypothetical protein